LAQHLRASLYIQGQITTAELYMIVYEGQAMRYTATVIGLVLLSSQALANHGSEHPLSVSDWKEVMSNAMLLEDSGLMPDLLPMIMRNRDALQLTNEQLNTFHTWRKENYVNTINLMDLITEKKVRFRIESLSSDVSSEHLLATQNEIQALQRELLKLKLSCRQLVMTTFSDEQWKNLSLIAADDPELSSLTAIH
jgi:hypothetical protein